MINTSSSAPPIFAEGVLHQKQIFKRIIRPISFNDLIAQVQQLARATSEFKLELQKSPNAQLTVVKVQQRCEIDGVSAYIDMTENEIWRDDIFKPDYRIEYCVEYEVAHKNFLILC